MYHILDGVCYIWWPSFFPGGEFVSVLSKDPMKLESSLENAGYAPENVLNPQYSQASAMFSHNS